MDRVRLVEHLTVRYKKTPHAPQVRGGELVALQILLSCNSHHSSPLAMLSRADVSCSSATFGSPSLVQMEKANGRQGVHETWNVSETRVAN